MSRGIALLVVDVVLLIDTFERLGVADPLELGLGGDVLLKVTAGAAALGRSRLCAINEVAVVVLARGFGAAIVHGSLLRMKERAGTDAVPPSGAARNHRIGDPVEAPCCKDR